MNKQSVPDSLDSTNTDSLLEKRATLIARLDAIKRDIRRGLDPDSEEQAVEVANAEVLDEIARVTQEELARIDRELADTSHTP